MWTPPQSSIHEHGGVVGVTKTAHNSAGITCAPVPLLGNALGRATRLQAMDVRLSCPSVCRTNDIVMFNVGLRKLQSHNLFSLRNAPFADAIW